jgi:hypothetical protein
MTERRSVALSFTGLFSQSPQVGEPILREENPGNHATFLNLRSALSSASKPRLDAFFAGIECRLSGIHQPNHAIWREEIARFVCSMVSATSSSIEDRMPARSVAISFRMWDTISTPFDVMRTMIFRRSSEAWVRST